MFVTLDDFRADYLRPARAECDRLEAEIKAAALEYIGVLEAREYDDDAAASVQLRVDELERDLHRWRRRVNYLTSCENAQRGGKVNAFGAGA